MPTLSEFLAYVISLVGIWVDQDGAYGAQCVDLILRVYVKFWNYFAWGNAIDFTRNGMPAGFTRGAPSQMGVRPGDILVWHFGPNDEYGHIGICIAVNSDGTVTSVEQNIDGTPETGGPGRYKTRNLTYCVAVIRPAFAPEAQEKEEQLEEEEMKNFVVRSKSGSQGYVGIVNGAVFGIGAIDTVGQLKAAGAIELVLDDGDFSRFLESQKFDDQKLVASVDQLTKTVASK